MQKTKPKSNRIAVLERQIKWFENYSRGNNGKSSFDVVKQLKQELAALLEEDAKADKLRNLPLYSYRITGWKFVCSKCYDKVYNNMLVQDLTNHKLYILDNQLPITNVYKIRIGSSCCYISTINYAADNNS